MNEINIGNLKMPLNAATKTFAVLAKRGAGKTYTAAVMAEEFHKVGIPFVVFDPIDVWWGLRFGADGKSEGLPVVVFGVHNADIKLERDMGARIAQAIVQHNISCVISTYGMPKVAQRQLIKEFSEELLNINDRARHVFIEEAHEFVPQRVFGAMGAVFAAVEALVVMGRNKGIGVTLINQRAATVNKDVLTQLDTLLAFRNTAPQDRKALREWVEAHGVEEDFDKFMKSLPSLPTGEGWAWSPEFLQCFKRIKIRKRETFHPDRESLSQMEMPKLESTDIQSFIDEFQSSETEEVTQDEPTETLVAPKKSEQEIRNEYESLLIEKDAIISQYERQLNQIRGILGAPTGHAYEPSNGKNEALIENLPNYEKDIMLAIKQHPNIPFTRSQLAVKSGKSIKSSAFSAATVRLRKLGLIQQAGNEFVYKP